MASLLNHSLLKILIMTSNVYCGIVVSKDPNPVTTPEERAKYEEEESAVDNFWTIHGVSFRIRKACMQAIVVAEFYSLVTRSYPHLCIPFLARILPALASTRVSHITMTPTFIFATVLIHVAALIRASCYRHLGSLFTFTLTLRPSHKLITSGPYAFVRHPSYLGSIIFFLGIGLALLGSGSWFGECVLRSGEGAPWWAIILAVDIAVYLVWTATLLIRRTGREDKMMRKEFGEQWDKWATKTPYKIFPYVY